ncbi:MAG: DUF167 domain-containing protein [Chloroflexi bacterium]|nr:DUF167 domain-containing protein [Chloroflexota bacterium]
MTREAKFSGGEKGIVLAIRVIPRARRDEIAEVLSDQTIKIRLTAPPVEGKTNQALVKFLSDVLSVSKARIEIVAGATGRDKLVSVMDISPQQAQAAIQKQLRR